MDKMIKIFLLLFMTTSLAIAQQTVTGVISDDQGLPLPGATVLIEGTTTGVTTDFDGNYSIMASDGDVLVISYVGYQSQSLIVGQDDTSVTLIAGTQLDEIVVSALGVSREKKSLGYAQQSVQGETLVQSKEVDLNVTLSGKVAGVQMIGGSSSNFDAGFLRLRGETGVLYVVDGIKVNSMTDINTDNIANISVLKGAAATALYGADALNGVVIVTSKKAKEGESTFTVDHTTNVTSVALLPEYQNEYGGGYYTDWDTFEYNPNTDPASWACLLYTSPSPRDS